MVKNSELYKFQGERKMIEENLYKIVPYHIEKRGNLKCLGIQYPVEYKYVKDVVVVHIKETLTPMDMQMVSAQLRVIFGEPIVLFALKPDITFFVAEPMTDEEVERFKSALTTTINQEDKEREDGRDQESHRSQ